MDPIRNPYAPGAGQRPPELAGRDRELEQFEVTLERVASGRPERSMVLSGLRGVGKTVLLNALRSQAVQRAWGTGKIEARPDRSVRIPVAQAVHAAVREVAHRHRDPDRVDSVAGVLKAYAVRTTLPDRKGFGWTPPVDVPAAKGRADSGDLELDLLELFTDVGGLAGDLGVGIALFVDEMQDIAAEELAALCGAVHEISQQGAPLVVVGAGLPHLPVALAASKSYAERLFRYVAVDRLPREMADRAWRVPAAGEGVMFEPAALDELYRLTDGYPYFVQAYGKVVWDTAVGTPVTADDVAEAAPLAEAELAIGFFGARYERATPAERDYMTAMADLGGDGPAGDGPVATAEVARHLGRKPQSLSPARDGLIKKGLVYSGERGSVAFTVPHFGKFLARVDPCGTIDRVGRPQVVAHRGASEENAEHTLAAYVAALDAGAEALECDVRLTADGHLVCVHDRDLRRTASRREAISTMELADLAELDFASWKNPWADLDDEAPDRDPEQGRVLTLRRLCEVVADYDRRVELAIETKHPTRYGGLVERRLVETLRGFGWDRAGTPARVMSFSVRALRRVERLAPDVPLVMLLDKPRYWPALRRVVGRDWLLGPGIDQLTAEPGLGRRITAAGHGMHVWTVNTRAQLDLCLELGVEAVITDRPAYVLDQLGA